MNVQKFYDTDTSTFTYVVYDKSTQDAIVIDPVLNFDPPSGALSEHSVQEVVHFIKSHHLKLHLILETHAHADHLSGAQVLKNIFPSSLVGIGEKITIVQDYFNKVFNLDQKVQGRPSFDFFIRNEERFSAGSLSILPIATPGHTPACMSYLIVDHLFTGDALFMPDSGTGRCDFPKGSADDLYESISRLYQLPDETKVLVGHDYAPHGREVLFQTTIGESKRSNIQLKSTTSKNDFVSFRTARDKTLNAPRLLLPSLQVNIAAGHLPEAESNGVSYLKLPLKKI